MSDIILHHYPTSPFAEKARVALGIKGLAWQSVKIPMIMPKPDLMPLTGGYRKTPVMQIGANIYCDTQLILRELERRHPEPSLYRGTDAGTANALAFWSDRSLFGPAVSVALGGRTTPLPLEFREDRAKFTGREFDPERMKAGVPFMLDQLRAQLWWYETMLADGRPFLLGKDATLVDCAAYHPCWFLVANLGLQAAPLAELPRIQAWMERVKGIGHGQSAQLSSAAALDIARDATPQIESRSDSGDPMGRQLGSKVQVVPDDTGRDPVSGELVAISREQVVIRRVDPRVGEVAIHFPRAGFVVKPAAP